MPQRAPAVSTPLLDGLLTGGISILGMGALLAYFAFISLSGAGIGGGERALGFVQGDWIALTILINSTHFMVSYRILYVSKAEIFANRWSTLIVPCLLMGLLLFGAISPEQATIYGWLVLVSSLYLAWHYTGQAWGMVASFGHLHGVRFTNTERLAIRFGMRALLALHLLYALSGRFPPAGWIAPATFIKAYGFAFQAVCLAVALGFGAGAWAFLQAHRRGPKMPIRAVIPWIALFLWYPFWYFIPGGFLWVQLSHALQYLSFPLRVEVNRYAASAEPGTTRSTRQKQIRLLVVYLALVVVGAILLSGPPLAAQAFGNGWYSTPNARAIFIAFTNCIAIHHYFIDGAIWKISNPKVRQELFAHASG
ncbi:MAG: hypothetical protein AB8G23_11310 [Myxococcota bacterium]